MEQSIGCQEKYRVPVPEDRVCPICGKSVEVFSRAGRMVEDTVCPHCGHLLSRQTQPVFAPEKRES